MLFDDDFVEGITEDPVSNAISVCVRVQQQFEREPGWSTDEHEALLEGYALLQVMKEAGLIPVVVDEPSRPSGDIQADCVSLVEYVASMRQALNVHVKALSLEQLKNKFSQGLRVGFAYEFSQADLHRIQTLINELRGEVASSKLFEDTHQARLLKRLEQLQGELHKRVSDLDRFWGLIGDAGVALGRFGTAAKPFVDRISEITAIVWNTQKQSEGLPSNMSMPLLNSERPTDPKE